MTCQEIDVWHSDVLFFCPVHLLVVDREHKSSPCEIKTGEREGSREGASKQAKDLLAEDK